MTTEPHAAKKSYGKTCRVIVCIVCALPEEARAFLEVVRQQYKGTIEERMSPRYQYSYRFATIKNDKDESLTLHISWLPRYGPQEMTLHLSRVLEECQPRIAIMTGICAGDVEQVQLGDLVVAERTFTYDNGKFTLDDEGRRVHQYDTLTYRLDANILQFLGLFDGWKPLVASLKRPLSFPQQREIACHIKPMASGSAVRADHPFEEVRAPVRGTVAIDMEGAAFGLVMSRHPLIPWLVVKGVCDYADRDKNDAYHDYAARASALYALCFIQHYVTTDRIPRRNKQQPLDKENLQPPQKVPVELLEEKIARFKTLQMDIAASKNWKEFWNRIFILQAITERQQKQYERLYRETTRILEDHFSEGFEEMVERIMDERLREKNVTSDFKEKAVTSWGKVVANIIWPLPLLPKIDKLLAQTDTCIAALETYKQKYY